MAKKKEKRSKKKDSAGPRDAVRGAVETTFQRAAGGASKAQELLEEIAGNVKALRDANLVERLEGVRDEVQSLAKRVAALEVRTSEEKSAPAKPAPRRSTASTARKPAAKKPTAAKTTGTRSTTRKPASSTTRKSSGSTTRKPAGTTRKSAGTAGRSASTAKKPSS